MKIREFITQFNAVLPLQEAEDFDNVGLLCGHPDADISGILVCHDALEEVVDEAIANKTNLMVTFHPIIFSGLKSITGKNYVEKAVMKAIENRIAIFAVHTALDNHYYGVNHEICNALGLKNQNVLMPKQKEIFELSVYVPEDYTDQVREALFEAGAGKIGFYDECSFQNHGKMTFRPTEKANPFSGKIGVRENGTEDRLCVIFESYKKNQIIKAMKDAHPYEEVAYQIYSLENENLFSGLGRTGEFDEALEEADFLQLVKEVFNLEVIRHSSLLSKKIKKVGVLGGSGASGISAAKSCGCDAYLTGDVKYHDFFQSEGKMLIGDIGHFESEQLVTQQLFKILSENFPKFAVLKSTVNTNPVNYFL